jgi:hypothetical protein
MLGLDSRFCAAPVLVARAAPVIYHATIVPFRNLCGTVPRMKEDLHLRVDTEIAQAVRAYAKANGIALAAAVSILLRRGLREEENADG